MKKEHGVLYGIGVGPGDPDLMTIKAVNTLKEVDIVFTAASTKNDFSLAVNIADKFIPEGSTIETLYFPMTKDLDVSDKAWKENADRIAEILSTGKNAAFLTLGDPMTYSTFGYILKYMQRDYPGESIEIIPGITSYQAAAARTKTILVEGEESLLLTSGAFGGERIRGLKNIENIALLKAYKNVGDITLALEEKNMLKRSFGISKCGREGEEIISDIRELAKRDPDYWTLILAKQSKNGTL